MKKLIAMAVVALMALPAAAQMQEAYPSYIQVTGRAEKEPVPRAVAVSRGPVPSA